MLQSFLQMFAVFSTLFKSGWIAGHLQIHTSCTILFLLRSLPLLRCVDSEFQIQNKIFGNLKGIGLKSFTVDSTMHCSMEKRVSFYWKCHLFGWYGYWGYKNQWLYYLALFGNLHVYARVYLILLFYAPKSYYKEYRLKLVIDTLFRWNFFYSSEIDVNEHNLIVHNVSLIYGPF